MRRNTHRILVTHVGSLVRPPAIREVMTAREQDLPYDRAAFQATLREEVAAVVRRQREAGVDVVSDGEFGKAGWIRYITERLDGFVHRDIRPGEKEFHPRHVIREVEKFPEFYAAYDPVQYYDWLKPSQPKTAPTPASGSPAARRLVWECTAPIRYQGHEAVTQDIENFKFALGQVEVAEAFLPVAAPLSARGLWINSHYPNEEAVLVALADALNEEYRAIVAAGLLIQLDDAVLAIDHDRLLNAMTPGEARKTCEARIELINYALRGIPEDKVRYHVCWGSWNAPHTTDVPLRMLADLILRIRAQAYALEAANPRHEHEWQVWKDVKLPDGKILIPGMVTHSTNVVEHPELVAWRIRNFASVVGRENVIAGTDCGFAQSFNIARVHPTVQWAKLEALAEGARLASRDLWRH